jgi:hypothetical protein
VPEASAEAAKGRCDAQTSCQQTCRCPSPDRSRVRHRRAVAGPDLRKEAAQCVVTANSNPGCDAEMNQLAAERGANGGTGGAGPG